MKKTYAMVMVWLMLGLLSLRAAPTSDYNSSPKWMTEKIWTSSAAIRSYAAEMAKYAVLSVNSDGVFYENNGSSQWIAGNGVTNLLSQINELQLKFTAKAGDPGYAKGYVYAGIYDANYDSLFSAHDDVEAVSTDAGWQTSFRLDFDLQTMISLPIENDGDEVQGVEVYIYDRDGEIVNSYWLSIDWREGTIRYPTGLTGDQLAAGQTAEIVIHRWNSTSGSYSQAYNLKTGEVIPLGEVTVVAESATVKGMMLSTTTAEVNPVSSNGIGTLPLVVLTVSNRANFMFAGTTTEGEKATGFRIRKLGPSGWTWQEYNLPTDTNAGLMNLDVGTYHIDYIWPTFREEERWVPGGWYQYDGGGKG